MKPPQKAQSKDYFDSSSFQPLSARDRRGQDSYKCEVPEGVKPAQNEMKFFSSHGAITIKGRQASISYSKLAKQTDGKGLTCKEKHTRTSFLIKMSSFINFLYVCLSSQNISVCPINWYNIVFNSCFLYTIQLNRR